MNPQIAQHGQRFNDLAGPGGLHDGGQGAGWWIISILAILLMITITGLLVWIGRTAAELRSSLVRPTTITPVTTPVPVAAPPATPSLMTDPEAPTEVAPDKPTT